jgi:hypothetical protein
MDDRYGTLACECTSNRFANTFAAASNQGALALQSQIHTDAFHVGAGMKSATTQTLCAMLCK